MLLTIFGGEDAGEAPVFRVDFVNDDVSVFGLFAEDAPEGVCDFADDLRFLGSGNSVFGDSDVNVRHVVEGTETRREGELMLALNGRT